MRETTPTAMLPCFDRWCQKFDNLLRTKAQKREFRHYVGGLLGEIDTIRIDEYSQFRTAMSFRFVQWLNQNCDVFTAYKASLGFVWA